MIRGTGRGAGAARCLLVAVLAVAGLLSSTASAAAQEAPPSPTAAPSDTPSEAPASVTVPDVPPDADPEGAADTPSPSASPSPSPSATSSAGDGGSAVEDAGAAGVDGDADLGAPPSAQVAEVLEAIAADDTPDAHDGLLHWLLGEEGEVQPTRWRHYDLGASVGTVERLFTNLARLIFAVGLWVMAFAMWLLEFVLRFDLGRMLATGAGDVAMGYAGLFSTDLGGALIRLVLVVTVGRALWQVARDRGSAAAAELLVAAVIAAVGGYLITHAEEAGCQGLRVMATTTVAMIELADGDGAGAGAPSDICAGPMAPPARGGAPPHQEGLIRTFVHEPFLLLQWGEVPEGDCRRVADALVAAGSWGDDDAPRDHMGRAGCTALAEFNREMTAERVAGTAAWTIATTALAIAIVLTAGTLLVAQVAGAVLVAAMPFAVVLGVAPGAGRQLLVRWVHGVLKVGVMFVGSGFFLTLLTTAVDAVQRGAEADLFVRMVSTVVVAWALVILRGQVFGSMRRAAATTAQGLAPGLDVGGAGRGPGAWAAGTAVDAAYTGLVLHQGVQGVAAGAALARRGADAAAGRVSAGATTAGGRAAQGMAAIGRAARLRRGAGP